MTGPRGGTGGRVLLTGRVGLNFGKKTQKKSGKKAETKGKFPAEIEKNGSGGDSEDVDDKKQKQKEEEREYIKDQIKKGMGLQNVLISQVFLLNEKESEEKKGGATPK